MKNAAKLFFKISPNTMNPTYPGTGSRSPIGGLRFIYIIYYCQKYNNK